MQTQPAELKGNNKDILQAPALPGTVKQAVVTTTDLSKTYGKGASAIEALSDVSLEIGNAQFTAIMGPSGSGKSTLMHCLAGLDTASSGSIVLDGSELTQMKERQLTRLRRDKIGFIFQSFNLVPTLTAKENITLPADISGKKISETHLRSVVSAIGLENRLSHRPAELSGGQQQRVACARALVTEPAVIFADEPTGNLDSQSTEQVLEFLRQAVDDFQQTVVMVTHDAEVAAWADRVIFLADGRVAAELLMPTRETVLDALKELGDPENKWVKKLSLTSSTTSGVDDSTSVLLPPLPVKNVPEQRSFRWEPPALTGQIPVDTAEAVSKKATVPLKDDPHKVELIETDTVQVGLNELGIKEGNVNKPGDSITQINVQTTVTTQTEGRVEDSPTAIQADSALPPPPLVPLEEALEQIAPAKPLPEGTSRVINQAQHILEELPGSVLDSTPASQSQSQSQSTVGQQSDDTA